MALRSRDLEQPARASLAQQKILDMLLDESTTVNEMLKSLYTNIANFNQLKEFKDALNEINSLKREVEEAKRKILDYISRAAPALLYKEEWLRLTSKMTSIVDKAVGIMYRLEQIHNDREALPDEAFSSIIGLAEGVLGVFDNFRRALNLTLIDVNRALEYCHKAEAEEKKVDELYRKANFKILELSLQPRDMILIREVAEMLEEIADTIEYATDDLRIILLNLL
ncbi:MAG: hypothetical protein B6U69_00670 [Thermofilum sp. ex4484_15]|nr:MAG: hypothetical protein B6U69_00670 [Thermofilum sp. ex4484_15]